MLKLALLVIFSSSANGQALNEPLSQLYRTECGSCHVPYPAALMTWRDWSAIMQNLDKHFGENAVLDGLAQQDIAQYLSRQASLKEHSFGSWVEPPRVSGTHWFRLTHGVAKKWFTDVRVGAASNCTACHRQADVGHFRADQVTLPN